MKIYRIIISLSIFPFLASAQTGINIHVKKVIGDRICDTCVVDQIYNSEMPISYMIIDAMNDYTAQDFQENSGSQLTNVSKYFIASGAFTLDFIPNNPEKSPLQIFSQEKYLKMQRLGELQLQFQISHNNRIIQDWTDIYSLEKDKNFKPGMNVKTEGDKETFLEWDNYHAGRFKMSINDSLIVLIRDNISKQTHESIFIKRVPILPKHFDFVKFSSDKGLQDILNMETSKEGIRGETSNNFVMESNEIAGLRFRDFRAQRNELEYAFADNPDSWKTLSVKHNEPSQGAFIILNPVPGKTIELLLRYKMQRESIHHVSIKVKEKATSNIWLKVALTIAVLSLSLAFWNMYKRIRHGKELKRLTLHKEETENKLQLLSGQLNPHFLFNSLNSVQNLINKQDAEQANKYVSEVSTFLRTIMDAGKKEYISLKEELEIETSYMKLEQKRMPFQYTIINECENDLSEVEFPPSLLQPVIENSIHHGFTKDLQYPLITIRISCIEKQLVVIVQDNGQGFKPNVVKHGHGLAIVQNRISLINKKLNAMPVEMQVQSSDAGTVTTFTFQNWL